MVSNPAVNAATRVILVFIRVSWFVRGGVHAGADDSGAPAGANETMPSLLSLWNLTHRGGKDT